MLPKPAPAGDPRAGPASEAAVSAEDLARQFGVSVETIRRDLRRLQLRRAARAGLRRGHPAVRAVGRGQLHGPQRPQHRPKRAIAALAAIAGRARGHDRHRRRHDRARGGPGAAGRVPRPGAHQLGARRDGTGRPARHRTAAVRRAGPAGRRRLLGRPRRGVLRRVLRRQGVPRLGRRARRGRAHRLLPGRGRRPAHDHRAHRDRAMCWPTPASSARSRCTGCARSTASPRWSPTTENPAAAAACRQRASAAVRGEHQHQSLNVAGSWPGPARPPPTPGRRGSESRLTTVTQHDDDALLPQFGYRQQFVRSLRHFESFAVAFSFISITTGIFTTFGFALTTGGPRAIWTWLIVVAGQALVALDLRLARRPGAAVRLLLPVGLPAGQRARRLVARLDVVRVPVDRHRVGRLRAGPGRVPAADRPGVHADQRGAGDARGAGPPGRADHLVDPDHHPGQQHRGRDRGRSGSSA